MEQLKLVLIAELLDINDSAVTPIQSLLEWEAIHEKNVAQTKDKSTEFIVSICTNLILTSKLKSMFVLTFILIF